jgi:acyl-CoA reductase-like NAD-dependent aldehyde dehydrogenase
MAKVAFPAWSRSGPQVRYEALKKVSDEILARKDELGRLLAREEGKILPEGIGEVVRAGQIFAFFAGEALRIAGEKFASVRPNIDVEITREPVGVVGLITGAKEGNMIMRLAARVVAARHRNDWAASGAGAHPGPEERKGPPPGGRARVIAG